MPAVEFTQPPRGGSAIWKVDAIERYAGERPAAWIDDNLDEQVQAWAAERAAPTLLVPTETAVGLCAEHVETLLRWVERARPGAVEHDDY